MTIDVISDNPAIQAHYEECLKNGCTPRLAEMLAFAQPPRADDDTSFLAVRRPREQFANQPEIGDAYAKHAKAAGMNITGAIYEPGLAQFPGDPNAWVRDRGEIRKKVEALGMGCEGAVNVKARNDLPPKPTVDIAPDVVLERALDIASANPEAHPKLTEELLHEAKESAKPHWAK